MILRRLSSAIRRQDWFTVLIETGIVVFGVFLGLQVNDWNAARADAARAAQLKVRLTEDFRILVDGAGVGEERLAHFTGAAETIYARLVERNEIADRADFSKILVAAGSSHPPTGGSPTYAEMLSTGDIGLIEEEALRVALIEYHVVTAQTEKVWDTFLPLIMGHVEAMDDHIIWTEPDAETGRPGVDAIDVDGLRASPEIFVGLARLNDNLGRLYGQQADLAQAVIRELDAEEGR